MQEIVAVAVALAILIAALIAASVLAPSPRRARPRWVAACALMGLGAPPVVLALEVGRRALTGGIAGAVVLLALATWLARGFGPGPGRDDPGSRLEQPSGPPPAWDWSEFDQARNRWSQPRTPA